REGHLELPSHFLADGVSKEVFEHRMGIGGYVKGFIRIDPRGLTCGDVPYGIATGLPDGDLVPLQFAPEFGGPFDIDKVDLDVLPGGDVQAAPGIFIRNIADAEQLGGSHLPIGQFDPDHLYPGLALSVD